MQGFTSSSPINTRVFAKAPYLATAAQPHEAGIRPQIRIPHRQDVNLRGKYPYLDTLDILVRAGCALGRGWVGLRELRAFSNEGERRQHIRPHHCESFSKSWSCLGNLVVISIIDKTEIAHTAPLKYTLGPHMLSSMTCALIGPYPS